jgi:hypothetical protein
VRNGTGANARESFPKAVGVCMLAEVFAYDSCLFSMVCTELCGHNRLKQELVRVPYLQSLVSLLLTGA